MEKLSGEGKPKSILSQTCHAASTPHFYLNVKFASKINILVCYAFKSVVERFNMEIERKKRRKEKKARTLRSKWIDFKLFSFYGLTTYSTYSKCGGKSHHGQGHGVFNIENSVMSNKETPTIFFLYNFYLQSRNKKRKASP